MKTSLDILNLIYTEVVNHDLGTTCTAVSGDIYKLERPDGSTLEDIVVNSLPVTSGLIQLGTANINIHVPDMRVTISGTPQYKPDTSRLAALGEAYATYFEHLVLTGYEIYIEHQAVYGEPEIHQHYLNLRLKIRVFN